VAKLEAHTHPVAAKVQNCNDSQPGWEDVLELKVNRCSGQLLAQLWLKVFYLLFAKNPNPL